MRRLIVNADDFGLSAGVNRGVARAHEQGIVTSASLMVRSPLAGEAAAYAAVHPRLSVGLHIDLDCWRYAGEPWIGTAVAVDLGDQVAIAEEIDAQLAQFGELMGCDPTHLDSHHHVHRLEPVRTVVGAYGERLDLPVRELTAGVRYEGAFFADGQQGGPGADAIRVQRLCALLRTLAPGVTELGCHPAIDDRSGSSYSAQRTVETATLCDPRVRAVLEQQGIALCSHRYLVR